MKRKAFTLIELLVVIAVIALLLAVITPALRMAKERAIRVICLNNQKQLATGWLMYAQHNQEKIVYGGTLASHAPKGETPWTHWSAAASTEYQQAEDIRNGALWPYMQDLTVYRCSAGRETQILRNYSIVDGLNSIMNGSNWQTTMPGAPLIKKTTDLRNTSARVIFMDEGGTNSTEGWCIWYQFPRWWDAPSVRHDDVTTLSFADGHSEPRQWEDPVTIALGKYMEDATANPAVPTLQPKNPDLSYMQIAVWGKLGYNPRDFDSQ